MRTLATLVFILALFSCSPVYLPNARNVPMLSKQGEVQAQLSFISGYNLQAAVAVTNHIALMGNGLYADSRKSYSSPTIKYTFSEFGLGYFSNSEKFYFEVFAGYGTGKSTSSDSSFYIHPNSNSGNGYYISTADYNRYFIQPSFGLKRNHFQGAIAYRISMMDFKSGTTKGNGVDITRTPIFFFEPALVTKFPFDKFVFSVQVGLSTPINKVDLYFDYVPIVISTGIGFRLGYESRK